MDDNQSQADDSLRQAEKAIGSAIKEYERVDSVARQMLEICEKNQLAYVLSIAVKVDEHKHDRTMYARSLYNASQEFLLTTAVGTINLIEDPDLLVTIQRHIQNRLDKENEE